jgi:regulator of replication initiation timing
MIDIEENDLTSEIRERIEFLNQEANHLEKEISQFKNVYEELDSLKLENEDLKKRLSDSEEQHNEFVASFKEIIKKRDEALRYLLQEVKTLGAKMNDIKVSLGNKNILHQNQE